MLLYFILSIVSHFQFLESSFFSKRVEIEFEKKCGHETVWYRISLLPCFEELELRRTDMKRKDSLETRAVLLTFSLELEISEVAI